MTVYRFVFWYFRSESPTEFWGGSSTKGFGEMSLFPDKFPIPSTAVWYNLLHQTFGVKSGGQGVRPCKLKWLQTAFTLGSLQVDFSTARPLNFQWSVSAPLRDLLFLFCRFYFSKICSKFRGICYLASISRAKRKSRPRGKWAAFYRNENANEAKNI